MKRSLFCKLLCLILCCILCFTLLASCFPTETPPNGDGDTTDTNNPNDGDNGDNNGDNKDDGNDVDDPNDDPTDDPIVDERYSFRPVIDEMPIVRINTADGSNDFATVPDRNAKLNGEIEYVDAAITIEQDDELLLNGVKAKVKARGNYTLNYEKKPIRIKFDKKQSVLGLNGGEKFKSWVLLADWKDLSMSNNSTAFYLGKTILGSDGYYSSDYRNVEVYLNGEYWGVYLLVEQQEAKGANGRTSAPAVEDDYEGVDVGYLVEYDAYYFDERNMPNGTGDPTFELTYNNFAPLKKLNGNEFYTYWAQRGYTVKSDIYSDEQLQFIKRYVENAYRIAYEAVYNNVYYRFNDDYTGILPTNGTAKDVVSAVIDVQSLVDTYVLCEIACDPDIAWSSFYISLDMTESGAKKLIFEAPWDFDSAFGIKKEYSHSAKMYAANCDNPWLILLVNEQWFQDMVAQKWAELIDHGVITTALELVELQKAVYEQYYVKNYERWQNRINYGEGEVIWGINTYTAQAQAADYLYRWLHKRFNYLNTQWGDGKDVFEESETPSIPEEGYEKYRFEAEDCEASYPISENDWHGELASGGKFLGDVDGWGGSTITLTIYVPEDCTVYLSVGLSKRSYDAYFCDWFGVSVNGGEMLDLPLRFISQCGEGEMEWIAWTDVYLMPIELKAGENTITFTTVTGAATNVDYFDVWSACEITAVQQDNEE